MNLKRQNKFFIEMYYYIILYKYIHYIHDKDKYYFNFIISYVFII
jgi:hypothetical protein